MDSNHTCLAVISLDSALKIDKNFYPHIIDDFESSFDDSDDSGEEQIKTIRLVFFENVLLEKKLSKNSFLREQL